MHVSRYALWITRALLSRLRALVGRRLLLAVLMPILALSCLGCGTPTARLFGATTATPTPSAIPSPTVTHTKSAPTPTATATATPTAPHSGHLSRSPVSVAPNSAVALAIAESRSIRARILLSRSSSACSISRNVAFGCCSRHSFIPLMTSSASSCQRTSKSSRMSPSLVWCLSLFYLIPLSLCKTLNRTLDERCVWISVDIRWDETRR